MKPHIEEAWRSLRLADRDLVAFGILARESSAHVAIVCFHAQQAVEKSLKAVLFSHEIEFRRTHNLSDLATLLRQNGVSLPVKDEVLQMLNPFAVSFRYDDIDVELFPLSDVAEWIRVIRTWADAEVQRSAASAL